MTTETTVAHAQRAPELLGQTVVVIGGSAGIGLETARQARAEGAEVIVTGRNPERLEQAAGELGALSAAAFDATDLDSLERFFDGLPKPIDHVMLSGSGPYYAPLREMDFEEVQRDIDRHLLLPIHVGLHAIGNVRLGGSLLFIGGTGGRRRGPGLTLIGALSAAMPAVVENLAVELAPIRVNLVAPGSWTRRCRRRCSATSSRRAATSSARRCPSGVSSDPGTSPLWPSIS